MKQEALSYFSDTHLTVIGMLLFIFAFSMTTFWVVKSKNQKHFDEMANMPLESEGDAS